MSRRAFVVVADAVGAGALPDAADYGDAGANTLAHVAEAEGGLRLPTLQRLGLGSILPLEGVAPAEAPVVHGRLAARGAGKDSATGHWELMGVVTADALPMFPGGFPPEIVDRITRLAGQAPLCNAAYDGLQVLEDFGAEHLRTRAPIVYTSRDSVLQIAVHEDVLPEHRLHGLCAALRAELVGELAVARVIARPFTGTSGAFARTDGRRDFAVHPPGRSYLEAAQAAGIPVHAVGKAWDLFAGVGFDEKHPAPTNAAGIASTGMLVDELPHGLVLTNLVETDQVYGHRKDTAGFHRALREIDTAVAGWLRRMRPGDLLILTADHGVDPRMTHSDHTREYVPLLAAFAGADGRRHDGDMADVGATVLAWLSPESDANLPGTPFAGVASRP
ncbi:MAG: phosphopentomutase [Solirubrobacteraceae bacterium]|nr:phosphopentomutase [Solirubrobacteraceae bacterium]